MPCTPDDQIPDLPVPGDLRFLANPGTRALHQLASLDNSPYTAADLEDIRTDNLVLPAAGLVPFVPALLKWDGRVWDVALQERRVVGALLAEQWTPARGAWKGRQLCEIRELITDSTIDELYLVHWMMRTMQSLQEQFRYEVLRIIVLCKDEQMQQICLEEGFSVRRQRGQWLSMVWKPGQSLEWA